MCFILEQNAGSGLIQERADAIPQQINIMLWIGMKKSLDGNVLTADAREVSPYISSKLFPEFRKRDDTTGFYLNFI
jgi:hypothetical protein